MKTKIRKRILTIIMSAALVVSFIAPSFTVEAGDVDDFFAGTADLYVVGSNGYDIPGQANLVYGELVDGYIIFRTEVHIETENKVSGTEIVELNPINGSNLDNIESIEYSEKDGPWTDATNYIINTNHEYTNKYSIKRKYRIKVTGNVSFSLHYKVYTPVGIANYASMFRNIVFENNGFSTWIERPDNDPENIQHNVANYGGEGEDPYPTKEGKLFAGWYTDKTYDTPYLESTGYAYAKFVDEAVLSSRHQWKNDHTALRFVSSIDSIDYDCVGFIFSGTYGDKVIEETDKSVTKVYKSIYAGEQQLSPTTISDESEYFFIYTVRNMDSSIGSSWTVTPYFVTQDGTKVLGETSTFSYTP